jgi:hypothetical protein
MQDRFVTAAHPARVAFRAEALASAPRTAFERPPAMTAFNPMIAASAGATG